MVPTLGVSGDEIGAIAVCGTFGIIVLTVVLSTVRRMSETRQREISRREIAAYIAEGSMTPEEGERLMNSGTRRRG